MVSSDVFVQPFNLLEISQETMIVYSHCGISTVKDARLARALDALSDLSRNTIPISELRRICDVHSLDFSMAYDYLANTAGVLTSPPRKSQWTNVAVVASEDRTSQALRTALKELPGIVLDAENAPRTMHVLVQEVYRPKAIESIYETLVDDDAIVTAYNFGGAFYIDAPYCCSNGLPCHFCQREYHLAAEAARYGEAAGQWSRLIRTLDRNANHLGCSLPLGEGERHAVVGLLYHTVRRILGIDGPNYDKRPGLSTVLNLRSGDIERHLIPHDPDCACVRSKWRNSNG